MIVAKILSVLVFVLWIICAFSSIGVVHIEEDDIYKKALKIWWIAWITLTILAFPAIVIFLEN